MQHATHLGAAGKQQAIDPGVACQRLAHGNAALHQVDHPGRQPGFQPALKG